MSLAAAFHAARKYANGGAVKSMEFQGIPIRIETPKGQIREGWTHRLPCDYGYIRHTEGGDGDQVDVFVGPNKDSNKVFIVDQMRRHKDKFDEHKCLVGFDSKKKAVAVYKAFYGREYNPHFVGAVTELSINAFKKWLDGGGGKKPVSPEVNFKKGGTVKATKATAHYRLGTKSEHCSICTMFRSPASCTSVKGHIRAQDTCDYFELKKYQEGGLVFDPEFLGDYQKKKTPNVRVMEGHQEFEPGYAKGWETEPGSIMNMRGQPLALRRAQDGGEVGEDWNPDAVPLPRPRPPPEPPEALEAGYPEPPLPGTEMKAYHPTWRERLGQGLMGDKPASPAREQFTRGLLGTTGLGEQSMSLSDLTPVGMGLGAQENIQHGKYREAALSVLPGMAVEKAAAAPLMKVASDATSKAGPEAVQYWTRSIVDHLLETHGDRPDLVAGALEKIRRTASPEAEEKILQGLPEQTRIGVMRHRMEEWNQPRPGEQGHVDPARPAFREITHLEEAKDWLRNNGHDPKDWGYSDPENYVDLANNMKREIAGLQPPPSDRVPVRTAPQQGASPLNALADHLEGQYGRVIPPKVIGSLDELFGLVSPHEVEHLSAADLLSIRDKLSRAGADAYHYQEKDPKLWNALHERFDALDRDMERHITWATPQRQEPPLHQAGPFQSNYDQGVVQQFSNYFNDVLGKHFSSQEEFANRYFGGLNTSRISARRGNDPYGSGAPALYFDGPLMHPNGDFVGSIERAIIPSQKYAYHGLLSLEPKYQGGELAPKMLREQIDAYNKMGLNYVKLNAGLTSGPYSWAKYGWIPEQASWNLVRSSIKHEVSNERLKISDPGVKDYLTKVLNDPDPRAMWQLADITAKDDFGNEIGRAALLGRNMRNATNIRFGANGWAGQLNLKNAESMERFNAYYKRQIGKPKKPKLVTE
jgi:hypothetical protein